MKKKISLLFLLFCVGCFNNPKPENKIALDSAHDSIRGLIQVVAKEDTTNYPDSLLGMGIEFGFSNDSGSQLLLIADSLKNPSRFTMTISTDGKTIPLRFLKKKLAKKEDNGRQIYFNFENCGGFWYEPQSGRVDPEKSALFISKKFLSERIFIETKESEVKAVSSSLRKKVEADKKRKVKNFKCLTELDSNRSIYLFEFQVKKDSALATLAYITPDKIVYRDFPEEYNEQSTWRVDDEGEFGINYFKILAVFENNGQLEIVTDWPGPEGYLIEYLKEDGATFKTLKTGYRYCAPI